MGYFGNFFKEKIWFFLLIQSYNWFSFQQINPAKSTENSVLLHKKKTILSHRRIMVSK